MVWRARQPHISSGGRSLGETPVDLDDDHRHRMQELARQTDRSQAELIREAIAEYLERHDVTPSRVDPTGEGVLDRDIRIDVIP